MIKKSRQKFKYLEISRWNKKQFSSLKGLSLKQKKIFSSERWESDFNYCWKLIVFSKHAAAANCSKFGFCAEEQKLSAAQS